MKRTFDLITGQRLEVTLTEEGVVFDLIETDGFVNHTRGMTADEWAEHLFGFFPGTDPEEGTA